MRKFRIIMRAATALLVVAVIAGAVVLVMAQNPALDTTFNIIAFAVSAASVAIAIASQVAAYNDRKKITQLVRSLNEIDTEIVEDEKAVVSIQRKLSEIIALDKELNDKLEKIELNSLKTGNRKGKFS